jgi:putative adhesin
MKQFLVIAAALAMAAIPALAVEATFERSLSVNGRVELTVATGSGNIHLMRGSGNQVHVFAKVKSNWGGSEERVREIAANPPIEQTGNIIRIGARHENLHNISIDYEIEAPVDAYLDAGSGSGNIIDDGIGENAKLNTGSGNIRATELHGGFAVGTGSGDIYAEQTGQGDVKAQTGSGNIELKSLRGGLHAETGSGTIKVGGTPTSSWRLETGSGNVEFWASDAPLTLDAETGSGSIHTDREMLMQGSSDRHHITGKLNGGGPTVRIETGSGSIRVH